MLRSVIVAMAVLFWAFSAQAEEELVKNGGTYLGRKTSDTVFTTCAGGQIAIGDGKLNETVRRCRKPVVAGPFSIRSVNREQSRVTVEDERGTQISFAVPAGVNLNQLTVGTSVTIGGDSAESRTFTTGR